MIKIKWEGATIALSSTLDIKWLIIPVLFSPSQKQKSKTSFVTVAVMDSKTTPIEVGINEKP